jgi:hypothetical protein
MRKLLERSGYRVHGKRADCHCKGSTRLTISFTDEVAHCHRCGWTANATQLARAQGLTVAPRRGLARRRKRSFAEWLANRYGEMAEIDYFTAKRADLARIALVHFPDMEAAWTALANRYHVERALEAFFEAARDKIGRLQLYQAWRPENDTGR